MFIFIYVKSYYKVNKYFWKHEFHDILARNQIFKKYFCVSWWVQISYDDVGIAFKFHNFVQMDLLPSMWRPLQYLHLLESTCRACYYWAWNKYFKKYPFVSWFKILLQYDVNIAFLLGFGIAMHYPSKFEIYMLWNPMYFWDNW